VLALPPAPQYKLLTGHVCYIGIDVASELRNSIGIEERWYKDGRYECFIDGKLVDSSPYWHGKPPFVLFDKPLPWEDR